MMLLRTFNVDDINSVLKHPDIWPMIADTDPEDFEPPFEGNHYLFSEGVLFILHPNGDDLQIHANVLPDNRIDAKQAAQQALEYGFGELHANRIIAEIPVKYGNVYGFAKKFMKDLGVINGDHFMALRAEEWVS
jgi:hypothetical protein